MFCVEIITINYQIFTLNALIRPQKLIYIYIYYQSSIKYFEVWGHR